MILKQCAKCGCFIPYGHSYCSKCQPIADAEQEEYKARSNKRYNEKRDPKYMRFYNSSDWKILSQTYIANHQYRCERCGAIASEVHHKVAIQTDAGWERRLDYDNLECLCLECHNKRHNRFQKRKRTKS